MFVIPYIENNHPNSTDYFFRGVQTTNQEKYIYSIIHTHIVNLLMLIVSYFPTNPLGESTGNISTGWAHLKQIQVLVG